MSNDAPGPHGGTTTCASLQAGDGAPSHSPSRGSRLTKESTNRRHSASDSNAFGVSGATCGNGGCPSLDTPPRQSMRRYQPADTSTFTLCTSDRGSIRTRRQSCSPTRSAMHPADACGLAAFTVSVVTLPLKRRSTSRRVADHPRAGGSLESRVRRYTHASQRHGSSPRVAPSCQGNTDACGSRSLRFASVAHGATHCGHRSPVHHVAPT